MLEQLCCDDPLMGIDLCNVGCRDGSFCCLPVLQCANSTPRCRWASSAQADATLSQDVKLHWSEVNYASIGLLSRVHRCELFFSMCDGCTSLISTLFFDLCWATFSAVAQTIVDGLSLLLDVRSARRRVWV